MNRAILLDAIRNSGGAEQPDTEVDGLLEKLQHLEDTGKYARLLASIASANDKSNFLSAVFEATFAFQFERSGLPLYYEVQQDDDSNSSIDFMRRAASDISIYFEARLLQQDTATGESIREQLHNTGFYRIAMSGEDEHDAIVRLQSVILNKVQNSEGLPVKFLRTANDIVNIVVIDVSDILLGAIDLHDCLLSTHGDPYVDEVYRRGIFGLFQKPISGYPDHIDTIAHSYEHIRSVLNGVLFLFKSNNSGPLDYILEHYMIWNPALSDKEMAQEVCREIGRAIPPRLDRTEAEANPDI